MGLRSRGSYWEHIRIFIRWRVRVKQVFKGETTWQWLLSSVCKMTRAREHRGDQNGLEFGSRDGERVLRVNPSLLSWAAELWVLSLDELVNIKEEEGFLNREALVMEMLNFRWLWDMHMIQTHFMYGIALVGMGGSCRRFKFSSQCIHWAREGSMLLRNECSVWRSICEGTTRNSSKRCLNWRHDYTLKGQGSQSTGQGFCSQREVALERLCLLGRMRKTRIRLHLGTWSIIIYYLSTLLK